MKFQEIILALQKFWSEQGCILAQPYDVEKGAGTMNPSTFLRVLGPEPWNVAYVEPSRRPADGRYTPDPSAVRIARSSVPYASEPLCIPGCSVCCSRHGTDWIQDRYQSYCHIVLTPVRHGRRQCPVFFL